VALNSSNVATESNIKNKLLANLSAANATTTTVAASAAGTAATTTTSTAAAATTTTAATNQALNFNNKVKATTATNNLQGNSAIKKHTSK